MTKAVSPFAYDASLTNAQFSNLASRFFAIVLQRLGMQKGDRVAIALPNIPQFPIAFYGALRAGAVVVPTNPLYTEREMLYQLADSGAKILVMLDTFYSVVRKIRQQIALEHIIVTNPADFLPPSLRLLYPLKQRWSKGAQPGLTKSNFAQDPTLHMTQPMLVSRPKGSIELSNLPVAIRSEDLAVLQYTGGTTGLSKGAMLTHQNLLANDSSLARAIKVVHRSDENSTIHIQLAQLATWLSFSRIRSNLDQLIMSYIDEHRVERVLTRLRNYLGDYLLNGVAVQRAIAALVVEKQGYPHLDARVWIFFPANFTGRKLHSNSGPKLFCPDGYDPEFMENEYFVGASTEDIAEMEDYDEDDDQR